MGEGEKEEQWAGIKIEQREWKSWRKKQGVVGMMWFGRGEQAMEGGQDGEEAAGWKK